MRGNTPSTLGRDHFERLHSEHPDPWNFETSEYERAKRDATLAALPRERYASALEIGCSIGVLTALLAERCERLLALDVAEAALAGARARCGGLPHVTFARLDVRHEFPEGSFDLIVLSEVGYFWSRRELSRVRRRIVNHLAGHGHLLLVHWTGPIPESPASVSGDEVHESFVRASGLRHCYGARETSYRLDLLERQRGRLRFPRASRMKHWLGRRRPKAVLHLDSPASGEVLSSSSDAHRIEVRGWAGARNGISTVEVFLDDEPINPVALYMPRPDVAMQFPEFGTDCGFSSAVRSDTRLEGARRLRVCATTKSGQLLEVSRDIVIRFRAPDFGITPRRLPDVADLNAFLATDERLVFRESTPAVSVILVLHNRAELTLACLRSLLASSDVGLDVVIVDNASTDATAALLDRVDGATVIRSRTNLHYVSGVNRGAREGTAPHLLLLNNDTEIRPGSIARALARLTGDPSIGAIGGRVVLYDGRLQEAGGSVWRDGRCFGYGRGDAPEAPPYMFSRDVDYCAGTFLLTPRSLFFELGGLNERYSPGYYDDADYCLRIWGHGSRVVFDPRITVWHAEHASYTREGAARLIARNRSSFTQQHREVLDRRPTFRQDAVDTARVHGARQSTLVVVDDVVRGAAREKARLRQRLNELLAAGSSVTVYPLGPERHDWSEIYQCVPESVEVMNGYGAAFLASFLDERRELYAVIVLASQAAVRAVDRSSLSAAIQVVDAAE